MDRRTSGASFSSPCFRMTDDLQKSWGGQSCPQPAFRPAGPARKRVRGLKGRPTCLLLLCFFPLSAADLLRQTADEARVKSEGCQSAKCHVGIEPMHVSPAVRLG